MDQRFRWMGLVVVIMTILVGVLAYQAGVSHGLMVAAPAAGAAPGTAVAPQAYYWPWWHFGFFPFGLLIWVFVFRLLFGCGFGRRWYYRHGPYDGPYNGPGWFDEWHQRAHERMNNPPKA